MAETGKERTRRIDTDYHRQVDAAVMLKRVLGLLAALAGMAYAGFVLHASLNLHRSGQLSTGELSQAHSAWNSKDCENCHTPNVPIRTDALWGDDTRNIQLNNQKCLKCHPSATGHFSARTLDNVAQSQSCGECHREHLGSNHDLVQVPDSHCVDCHADLSKIAKSEGAQSRAAVTSFAAGGAHPTFRSLQTDTGTIAFSHVQHLRPGQPMTPGDRTEMTLERIPEKYRSKYRSDDPSRGAVQLACRDCHQPDSSWPEAVGPEAPIATARSNHRFYKPIEFEQHCAACHQLPFDAPHGLDRKATYEAIAKSVAGEVLNEPKSKRSVERIDEKLNQARAIFDQGQACRKCHEAAPDNDVQLVLPGKIPQRWLQASIFSHGAHQDVDCKRCHAAALAKSDLPIDSRREARQVMIGGIEICAACHVSRSASVFPSATGGELRMASGECLQCHRYHVDRPPASHGAATL